MDRADKFCTAGKHSRRPSPSQMGLNNRTCPNIGPPDSQVDLQVDL